MSLGPRGFGAVVQPSAALAARGPNASGLHALCDVHREFVRALLRQHGVVLFRGWNMTAAGDFDRLVPLIVPGIAPELYVGTSPRTQMAGTRFVSTASEIPAPLLVPEHLEMSFKPNPPQFIFFQAALANPAPGGQTPLADFRQVWRELPRGVQDTFRAKGISYERWYFDETQSCVDPLKTK